MIRVTVFRCACEHGDMRTGLHKVLADTLTLFQPEQTDYAHHMLISLPSFESQRQACKFVNEEHYSYTQKSNLALCNTGILVNSIV